MRADTGLGGGRSNWGWGSGMTKLGQWGFLRAVRMTAAGLAAAGLASVGAASAADMLPIKAPAYKTPYNWSGCYVGAYFGWGIANDWHSTDVNNFGGTAASGTPGPGP